MKISILLFFILAIIKEAPAQMNSEEIEKIIRDITSEFAPDKRTAIFSINYSFEEDFINLTGETNIPEAKDKLLSSLKKLKIIDQITVLPSKELAENIYGIVNLSVANIRTNPDHSAELATQVLLGSRLKILKSSGEWYQVQCEDEYIGWIDDDGLYCMDQIQFDNWNKADKVIITAPFVFSYSEPNANSQPVSDVVQGNLLRFISSENQFVRAEFPDGRIGFVFAEHTKNYSEWLESRTQNFESIFHTAETLMGIPYVWGGTSIKGLDCSGFTKIVFQLNGVQLPRDASQQVHIGELIETENGFDKLLPGDLLFFGTKNPNSQKERITHVAIYLGNLDFIHASGRVRINSFDRAKSNFAENRLKTFIKAKRVLNSIGTNGVIFIKELNQK